MKRLADSEQEPRPLDSLITQADALPAVTVTVPACEPAQRWRVAQLGSVAA